MSWFSKHFGIHLDSHTLGNLMKNVSPALAFTPLGLPGAAALAMAGQAARGKTGIGDLASAGLSNAAIGGGARAGLGALRAAFVPSSSAAANGGAIAGAGSAGAAGGNTVSIGGMSMPGPTAAPFPTITAPGGGSGMSSLSSMFGNGARSAGSFVKDNPMATAMGLQGLGQIGSMGSENAYRHAQTDALNQQTQASQFDLDAQRKRAQALAPLLQALMGRVQNSTVAANPYL